MQLKTYSLADFNNEPHLLQGLYEIFRQTLNPDLTIREFNQYLFGVHPESFEVSFIYEKDELAGFCTAGAYPLKVNKKKVIVFRSAFGIQDKYKKGRFPLQGLFFKYMRYKFRHPFTPVYITGFMANPLMYAMICKYTLTCYPHRNRIVPNKILRFKDQLLQSMRLTRKEVEPFVLKIHFQVKFKEADINRFETSTDPDVGYYLSINPEYREKMGVLVLIPVNIPNMLFTLFMYLSRRAKSYWYRINSLWTRKYARPSVAG